jgi:hypothetical protein
MVLHETELRPGRRIWVHTLGQYQDAYIVRWQPQTHMLLVRFIGVQESVPVAPLRISIEQPVDCGRMLPPSGKAGIVSWLQRDSTVFAPRWPMQVWMA